MDFDIVFRMTDSSSINVIVFNLLFTFGILTFGREWKPLASKWKPNEKESKDLISVMINIPIHHQAGSCSVCVGGRCPAKQGICQLIMLICERRAIF